MDVTIGPLTVDIQMKHLDYSHFYAASQIDPSVLLKWGEFGRAFTVSRVLPGFADEFLNGKTMFLRWQQFTFTDDNIFQATSNFKNKMSSLLTSSICIHHWVAGVGKSSLSLQYEIIDQQSGKTCGYGMAQPVCIDLKTRKPTEYSSKIRGYIKERLSEYPVFQTDMHEKHGNVRYEAPNCVFVHKTRAPYFSIDHNNHVNQAFYIKMWLDAINSGIKSNAFNNVLHDLIDLDVQRMSFLYIKEVNVGDDIAVKVWQNDDNALLFHIHAVVNGRLTHQSEVLFSVRSLVSKL